MFVILFLIALLIALLDATLAHADGAAPVVTDPTALALSNPAVLAALAGAAYSRIFQPVSDKVNDTAKPLLGFALPGAAVAAGALASGQPWQAAVGYGLATSFASQLHHWAFFNKSQGLQAFLGGIANAVVAKVEGPAATPSTPGRPDGAVPVFVPTSTVQAVLNQVPAPTVGAAAPEESVPPSGSPLPGNHPLAGLQQEQ